MTVTLSKRLFEDSAAALASPQAASKKLRVLGPLSDHQGSTGHVKPSLGGLGPLQQQQHHSGARKRRHDPASDSTNAAASPSNTGKRGKRGDGRPSTAAASPNSAKSALEALLTSEGLEKDLDLEAEVAYITARQGTAAAAAAAAATTAEDGAAAGASSSGTPVEQETPAAAAISGKSVQDAARSSREKRRDQDQNPRARRASGSHSSIGSRDQVASLPTSPEPTAAAAAGGDDTAGPAAATTTAATAAEAEAEPDSPRPVSLDLVGDKEWQRLFAVLTISDASASRRSCSSSGMAADDPQPGSATAAAAGSGPLGAASHRLTPAAAAAAAALAAAPSPSAAAAAAPLVQEAPSTSVRMEACGSGSQDVVVTPSRRGSFLAGEFNRVQQQRLNTPPPAPAARSVRLHTYYPSEHGQAADCDMAA